MTPEVFERFLVGFEYNVMSKINNTGDPFEKLGLVMNISQSMSEDPLVHRITGADLNNDGKFLGVTVKVVADTSIEDYRGKL